MNPLILETVINPLEEEILTVKHMFDVKGIRFLYTQKTIDLIMHHLVHGFNY